MTTAKIIVNPYSGRWKAKAAIPDIERSCQASSEFLFGFGGGSGRSEPVLREEAVAASKQETLVGSGTGAVVRRIRAYTSRRPPLVSWNLPPARGRQEADEIVSSPPPFRAFVAHFS